MDDREYQPQSFVADGWSKKESPNGVESDKQDPSPEAVDTSNSSEERLDVGLAPVVAASNQNRNLKSTATAATAATEDEEDSDSLTSWAGLSGGEFAEDIRRYKGGKKSAESKEMGEQKRPAQGLVGALGGLGKVPDVTANGNSKICNGTTGKKMDQIISSIVEVQVSNISGVDDDEDFSENKDSDLYPCEVGQSTYCRGESVTEEDDPLLVLVSDSDHFPQKPPSSVQTQSRPLGREELYVYNDGHYRQHPPLPNPTKDYSIEQPRMKAPPRNETSMGRVGDEIGGSPSWSTRQRVGPHYASGKHRHQGCSTRSPQLEYNESYSSPKKECSGQFRLPTVEGGTPPAGGSGSQRRRSVSWEDIPPPAANGNDQGYIPPAPQRESTRPSSSYCVESPYSYQLRGGSVGREGEYKMDSRQQYSCRSFDDPRYEYSTRFRQDRGRQLPSAPYTDNRGEPRRSNSGDIPRNGSRRVSERVSRSHKQEKARNQEVVGRMEDLLYELFPKRVARALRDGKKVEPESFECVTVCFMDIVGYTVISSKLSAVKISSLLDRLYTKFDHLCGVYEVFKVETVGDAYMTVTNLAIEQHDHVKRMTEFVIDAIEIASQTLVDEDDLSMGYVTMRGGVHSGPVVAHVIGSRTPRYSLIGDTVNTSSRMESHSLPGRIQLSEVSAELLKQQGPDIPIRCRGTINVKGKGEMTTYWAGFWDDNDSVASSVGPGPGGPPGVISSNASVGEVSLGEISGISGVSGLSGLTEQEEQALEAKLIKMAMEQSLQESRASSCNVGDTLIADMSGMQPHFSVGNPSINSANRSYTSMSHSHVTMDRASYQQSADEEAARFAELEQEREMLELAIQRSLQDSH